MMKTCEEVLTPFYTLSEHSGADEGQAESTFTQSFEALCWSWALQLCGPRTSVHLNISSPHQILMLSIYQAYSRKQWLLYSYSVPSVSSSSRLRRRVPGDFLVGGGFPLLVVIWMSWSTYSANQQLRLETRVPPDASTWSRFRNESQKKGFERKTSAIWHSAREVWICSAARESEFPNIPVFDGWLPECSRIQIKLQINST